MLVDYKDYKIQLLIDIYQSLCLYLMYLWVLFILIMFLVISGLYIISL